MTATSPAPDPPSRAPQPHDAAPPPWATRAEDWQPDGPGRRSRWCSTTLADGLATVGALQCWDGSQATYTPPTLTVATTDGEATLTAAETARLDTAWTAVVATMRQADALAVEHPADT